MSISAISHQGMQVGLPVRESNKQKWDTLGVKWLGSFEGNPFMVTAELPFGWSVREKAATDFDKRSFIVLDGSGMPKADVFMKTVYDQWAIVNLFSDTKAAAMKVTLALKPGNDEFESLLTDYNTAVCTTYGLGPRGQISIDIAYAKLAAFVETHPEFGSELPRKHQCHDDRVTGLSGVMMALASNSKEGKCPIQ